MLLINDPDTSPESLVNKFVLIQRPGAIIIQKVGSPGLTTQVYTFDTEECRQVADQQYQWASSFEYEDQYYLIAPDHQEPLSLEDMDLIEQMRKFYQYSLQLQASQSKKPASNIVHLLQMIFRSE